MRHSVLFQSGTIQAGGFGGLDHTGLNAISKQVAVKADGCRRQGTNARLHKDVGRLAQPLGSKLLLGLAEHGGISLHHPLRDVLVTFPRCVGDHFPAVTLRVLIHLADSIIIVPINNDYLRATLLNCLDTSPGSQLMNIDHRFESHLRCRPRHSTPVIPVGRGGKGYIPQFFPDRAVCEIRKRQFRVFPA